MFTALRVTAVEGTIVVSDNTGIRSRDIDLPDLAIVDALDDERALKIDKLVVGSLQRPVVEQTRVMSKPATQWLRLLLVALFLGLTVPVVVAVNAEPGVDQSISTGAAKQSATHLEEKEHGLSQG